MPVCSGPMSPRVALLSPFAFPSVRGNAVTVARVARGLRARGVELDVWDLSLRPEAAVEAEVDAFRPAVIHAFHAYRVGPLALRLARRAEIPLVVTLTGTDANHDLFDPERASVVRRVLEGASRLTVFHASIAERIAGALPDLRGRLIVVPQSAALLDTLEPFDLGAHWDLPQERVLLAFPAGIRMVKRPRFPLQPLERVVARRPSVRLLYVGPVLDADERDALHRALEGRPWAPRPDGLAPRAGRCRAELLDLRGRNGQLRARGAGARPRGAGLRHRGQPIADRGRCHRLPVPGRGRVRASRGAPRVRSGAPRPPGRRGPRPGRAPVPG